MSSQPNDLSIHSYTEEGEIMQIKYASLAIAKSNPLLCFNSKIHQTKVMIAGHRPRSSLSIPTPHEKCIRVLNNGKAVVGMIGYPSDRVATMNYLTDWSTSYFYKYGDNPSIQSIASSVSAWLVRGMYSSSDKEDTSLRPIASSAVFADLSDIVPISSFTKVDIS
jgi:20S proteasome alpha/beta subunit